KKQYRIQIVLTIAEADYNMSVSANEWPDGACEYFEELSEKVLSTLMRWRDNSSGTSYIQDRGQDLE
ncbi:unnamed protein product, partial [Didymodactylos carnosus]